MSKTTFLQRFDRVSKFYDNAYHHHKATFKGFGEFYRNYCAIEKDYANQLLRLSEGINNCIVDFTSELPYIQQGMREVCGNLERTSQLHFNFAERLREIGDYCREEYASCKRNKEKFMKLNFEKSAEEHEKAKESRNRNILNQKEKEICRRLHNTLDQFMDDEAARTQKLKEQLVIYFSLSKKIAEKELELTGAYSLKMAQYEIHVKVPQVAEMEEMIIDQFNSYGEEKIEKKVREVNQQIAVHRQSLRDSIMKRERQLKVEDYQSKMQQIIQKYSEIPEELNYPDEGQNQVGLFDTHSIPNYRIFTREFKSESIRELAFAWLSCFYLNSDDQEKSFLTVIKTNLKVKAVQAEKVNGVQQFINIFAQKSQEYKWTLHFLVELSQFYAGNINLEELGQVIKGKKSFELRKGGKLHWRILIVFVDALLQSIIIIRDGYSLLYDEYIDILKMITTFAKQALELDPIIPLLLLLRKFQRALSITNSSDEEIIEQVFQQKLEPSTEAISETEPLRMQMGHRIISFLTEKMSRFYGCKISFSNLVKLSLCVQKALPKNYFTALEHMHQCIKRAGFNFLVETDDEKKVIEGGIWRGEERLRNLTEILEQLEYDRIKEDFFEPIANSLTKLIGVGREVILGKMLREFLAPTWEVIACNLSILAEQEGTDREGYVLRLGLCLAELDMQQPQDVSAYDPYFRVLETYLAATEKDYDTLLEHSRKTELWIVEQNSQATQNCIDFCSLLYKPFEFLLSSLKKLEQAGKQTEFTRKYDQFIKLKLNDALKGQIDKYVKFLLDSLANYISREPELSLKPKRNQLVAVGNDQVTKQRYSFREMTRRLFNLTFLKEQLEEIVSDFIEKEVYEQLELSIFNLQLLKQAASKPSPRQDLLQNIAHIATIIVNTEGKLIGQMAAITVFHFLRRLFNNLYFQEERGFFSTGDVKLSEHTFQKYEGELEELLMNMSRNIPAEGVDEFSRQVCIYFFRAFRLQVLNIHKFKLGLPQQAVLNQLKSDLAFACALLRKKFLDTLFVREGIEEPAKALFRDLQTGSQKLMERFSDASLKHNNDQARYVLGLLNLRSQEKAQDFVQKYKKVLK